MNLSVILLDFDLVVLLVLVIRLHDYRVYVDLVLDLDLLLESDLDAWSFLTIMVEVCRFKSSSFLLRRKQSIRLEAGTLESAPFCQYVHNDEGDIGTKVECEVDVGERGRWKAILRVDNCNCYADYDVRKDVGDPEELMCVPFFRQASLVLLHHEERCIAPSQETDEVGERPVL